MRAEKQAPCVQGHLSECLPRLSSANCLAEVLQSAQAENTRFAVYLFRGDPIQNQDPGAQFAAQMHAVYLLTPLQHAHGNDRTHAMAQLTVFVFLQIFHYHLLHLISASCVPLRSPSVFGSRLSVTFGVIVHIRWENTMGEVA